jgi:hypothetical protein
MKLKDGFILRQVAGQIVVLPSGNDLNLNMMITLNETGKFIWNLLEQDIEESDIVSAILKEYKVDRADAEAAVTGFIRKLNEHGFLAD